MKNESLGRNQVIGEVGYLEYIGHDFVKSAKELLEKNEQGSGGYFASINLLATQALELLPKSLLATSICLVKNNDSLQEIRRVINKRFKCLGHDIDDIFNEPEISELKNVLGITNIKRINNQTDSNVFIDEFRFTVKNNPNEKVIRIKNLEATRYGLFAKNVDVGGNSSSDMEDIVSFLEKLSDEVENIRIKMIKTFDEKNKKVTK